MEYDILLLGTRWDLSNGFFFLWPQSLAWKMTLLIKFVGLPISLSSSFGDIVSPELENLSLSQLSSPKGCAVNVDPSQYLSN